MERKFFAKNILHSSDYKTFALVQLRKGHCSRGSLKIMSILNKCTMHIFFNQYFALQRLQIFCALAASSGPRLELGAHEFGNQYFALELLQKFCLPAAKSYGKVRTRGVFKIFDTQ